MHIAQSRLRPFYRPTMGFVKTFNFQLLMIIMFLSFCHIHPKGRDIVVGTRRSSYCVTSLRLLLLLLLLPFCLFVFLLIQNFTPPKFYSSKILLIQNFTPPKFYSSEMAVDARSSQLLRDITRPIERTKGFLSREQQVLLFASERLRKC